MRLVARRPVPRAPPAQSTQPPSDDVHARAHAHPVAHERTARRRVHHVQLARRRLRQVDDAAVRAAAAIVDPHDDRRAAVARVTRMRVPNGSVLWAAVMPLRVVALARGGAPPGEAAAVVAGLALLDLADGRVRRRRARLAARSRSRRRRRPAAATSDAGPARRAAPAPRAQRARRAPAPPPAGRTVVEQSRSRRSRPRRALSPRLSMCRCRTSRACSRARWS